MHYQRQHQQSRVLAVAGRVWNVWVWGISDISSVVFRGYSSLSPALCGPGLRAHCSSPNKGIGGGMLL